MGPGSSLLPTHQAARPNGFTRRRNSTRRRRRSRLLSGASSLCDISLDHSQLLIGSSPETPVEHPMWILSVLGGSPRRLGDIAGQDAEWTPDGKGFVYGRGADVCLANSDGTGSRKLLTTPGFASGFRWSRDGRVIRFTVTDQTTNLNSIWEASSDGSHLHPLLSGWNDPSTGTGWAIGRRTGDTLSSRQSTNGKTKSGPSGKRRTICTRFLVGPWLWAPGRPN
jgi:hypothetical protein